MEREAEREESTWTKINQPPYVALFARALPPRAPGRAGRFPAGTLSTPTTCNAAQRCCRARQHARPLPGGDAVVTRDNDNMRPCVACRFRSSFREERGRCAEVHCTLSYSTTHTPQ